LNQKVDKILHVGETADGERYIFITEIFGKHKGDLHAYRKFNLVLSNQERKFIYVFQRNACSASHGTQWIFCNVKLNIQFVSQTFI